MTSRPGLEIKAAMAADAPFLIALLAEAGETTSAPALADALEALRREGGVALMAQAWGPPSGLVALHWYRPLIGPRRALMSLLIVAQDARRSGVGRLLLKSAAQAARAAGCDAVHALVPPHAHALAAFCRATGFSEDGEGFVRPLRRRG